MPSLLGAGKFTSDLVLAAAMGRLGAYSVVTKFGLNGDVDAGTPEDVWAAGDEYTGHPLGAAEKVEVFSGEAADAAAGTGARTINILGLDADWNVAEEVITLNGVTGVDSVNTYQRINRMYVLTAGSGGANAGVITCRHKTTTANVFATISAGINQTTVACYTIPADKTGYVTGLYVSLVRASGAAGSGAVALRVREPGSVFRARRLIHISNSSPYHEQLSNVLMLPEKTDLKLRVESVSDGNSIISGEIVLLLRDND